MTMIKSALVVSILTFCSRVLGYIRDIFIASILGVSGLADAFFVAFRLPNMFRQLSAEGAFHNAFVPMFSEKLEKEGKEKASSFASNIFLLMILILTFISSIIIWQMPVVMKFLAPGYVNDKEKFELVVNLGRILFPYILFISLVSLFNGMLNSFGKFAVSAGVPMILNLTLILGLFLFSAETPAHNLSYSVLLAGILQIAIVAITAHIYGIKFSFGKPRFSNSVKTLFKRMVPGIVGGGVTQIAIWINTVIATLIPSAVSYLYYADRLVQFPLALIGTAIGTALLPNLSKNIQRGNKDESNKMQNKAIEFTMMLCIPAAFALFIISELLISVMFERGAFDSQASIQTARALSVLAFGLPGFALVKVLAPGFFAVGDTKTPVIIALVSLSLGVIISLSTINQLEHVGLALATSLSTWFNALILALILIKRKMFSIEPKQSWRLLGFLFSAIIMSFVLDYMLTIEAIMNFHKMVQLLFAIIVGIMTYFVCAYLLKATSKNRLRYLLS